MGDYIKTIRYGKPPVPGIIACLPVQENNDIMGIDFILVYLHETVIAGLTTYRGLKHFRHVRSPLWITLFREGIIYYFLISISTIVAVILLFRLPVSCQALCS
ncbi:hypothetical protein SERLADRAFT_366481 [Serpula lacrymans var. lacrymans S7.9]|uniref:Uncharacterized protein n=1 Tax=Serpula lacrymans var. lacrymans (strain S7.9) TaxID=578457 RepID=F8NKL3_SERL9|nr:uncharacterized protein SERLADRAFT_366481 [Serpula lacrymans var. lacrymans S7.9]EGO28785.1 hypothetical protein SERLADRAFT_366481 [Serpula lacrymans var. lacrymans S7.9]